MDNHIVRAVLQTQFLVFFLKTCTVLEECGEIHVITIRTNKKISLFGRTGLKILGRVGA